jgi:integrase
VSEATGADIEHLGIERGHRTLVVTHKGGKVVTIPLAPRTAKAIDLVLAAVQGERQRAGCVFAGERGFRGGSGCGGVACDDTVSVSEWDGPPRYLFAKSGEGREGARRHHCSR